MNYERLRRIVKPSNLFETTDDDLVKARVIWKIEEEIYVLGLTMSRAAKAMGTTVAHLKDMTARRLEKFTQEELENYLKRLTSKTKIDK